MKDEYESKYYNRYYGKRRARVADTNDPEKRGRIRVQCAELYGNGMSDWALPNYPFYGGRGCGFMSIPPIGSMVWIECEEGFADYPIYTGGFFDTISDGFSSDGSPVEESSEFQSDSSAAPKHAKGYYDGSDQGGIKGNFGVPPSSFEANYGDVTILQTPSGHMLEFDDTEDGERIQIHHKKGSHIEILPDGTINIISSGNILTRSTNRKEIVGNNKTEEVAGNTDITNVGDFSTTILGNNSTTVRNSVNYTAKASNVTITDDLNLDTGNLTLTLSNLLSIEAGGDLALNSFGDTDIFGVGRGYFSFSNSLSLPPEPTYVTPAISLVGSNGTAKFVSGDPTQEVSTYGIEARGGAGGQVYLGALTSALRVPTLGVGPVPLVKENAVCGVQLLAFLQAVVTTLNVFFEACTAPPAVPPAAAAATLALTAAQTTFLTTPSPTQPLILSEVVYLSKV